MYPCFLNKLIVRYKKHEINCIDSILSVFCTLWIDAQDKLHSSWKILAIGWFGILMQETSVKNILGDEASRIYLKFYFLWIMQFILMQDGTGKNGLNMTA